MKGNPTAIILRGPQSFLYLIKSLEGVPLQYGGGEVDAGNALRAVTTMLLLRCLAVFGSLAATVDHAKH